MTRNISLWRQEIAGLLQPYHQLVAKADSHAFAVVENHGEQIACRPGCCDCCRLQTVFAVEAMVLALALEDLPPEELTALQAEVRTVEDGECPLLQGGLCRIYAARPLICRTHGLPLLVEDEEGRRIDYCPQNFQGVTTLSGESVLDLDRLNLLLAAVNRQFLGAWEEQGGRPLPERLTLAAVVRLQL